MKRFFLFATLLLTMSIIGKGQPMATIKINDDIFLQQIKDSVFTHVTYHADTIYGRFSSNGLIFIKKGEALMVDTPMDKEQTRVLCEYLLSKMGVKVTKFIAGHFHDDCIGGLEYLKKLGIESVANRLTIDLCIKHGLPVPSLPFDNYLKFSFNGEDVVCQYFGGGHTIDNIVVWFPAQKVLFGGCLIKSIHSSNLGNLADAVLGSWRQTVLKVIDAFPEAEVVIPGHGAIGDSSLLKHTVKLVESHVMKLE
ncbi:MAG: subclass B1 metallo-beta-lactamase [Tenuifilaceae bacterium]|jgi:metallo-beta-lactamase class B|nr:subclass B1 metallo-beta-lactamase [Tenuifilaceae bacterium]